MDVGVTSETTIFRSGGLDALLGTIGFDSGGLGGGGNGWTESLWPHCIICMTSNTVHSICWFRIFW